MRVISGICRGLRLNVPIGDGTRPTTDRVKESVFNIIQMHLPAGRVLDLFAGSGALGIEALSRQSLSCVFVENTQYAYELVRRNIELARFENRSELVFSDAISYLDSVSQPFDIIFLDPPYNKGLLSPVLEKIDKRELLFKGGIIVVETEKNGEVPEHHGFEPMRCAVYGKTVITVLKRGGN